MGLHGLACVTAWLGLCHGMAWVTWLARHGVSRRGLTWAAWHGLGPHGLGHIAWAVSPCVFPHGEHPSHAVTRHLLSTARHAGGAGGWSGGAGGWSGGATGEGDRGEITGVERGRSEGVADGYGCKGRYESPIP